MRYVFILLFLAGCSSMGTIPNSIQPANTPQRYCDQLYRKVQSYYRVRGGSVCFDPVAGPFGNLRCGSNVSCQEIYEHAIKLRIIREPKP